MKAETKIMYQRLGDSNWSKNSVTTATYTGNTASLHSNSTNTANDSENKALNLPPIHKPTRRQSHPKSKNESRNSLEKILKKAADISNNFRNWKIKTVRSQWSRKSWNAMVWGVVASGSWSWKPNTSPKESSRVKTDQIHRKCFNRTVKKKSFDIILRQKLYIRVEKLQKKLDKMAQTLQLRETSSGISQHGKTSDRDYRSLQKITTNNIQRRLTIQLFLWNHLLLCIFYKF